MAGSPVDAVIIHAVYLINCATKDKELRNEQDQCADDFLLHVFLPDESARTGCFPFFRVARLKHYGVA